MSFSSTMTDLADGFRKRFSVTSKLSIDDMIKLVTPPAFQTIKILSETNTYFNQHGYPIKVPDHAGTAIQLAIDAEVQCGQPLKWDAQLQGQNYAASQVATYGPVGPVDRAKISLSIILPPEDDKKWTMLFLKCDPLDTGVIFKVDVTASAYEGG